ncbi:hypothetical protein QBE52_15095 [Clostridiaceae bacterium 35-E11]
MNYDKYLEDIEKRLKRNFDLKRDFVHKNMTIDLFAQYLLRNEKYVGSKKINIYAFENHEYCLIKHFSTLDIQKIQEYTGYLQSVIDDFVIPHEEHMSSVITGVIVADDNCSQEVIDRVKKFKYHKSFAFGFKGWVDIRLVLVLLDKGEVITNKKGKEVQKVYQAY